MLDIVYKEELRHYHESFPSHELGFLADSANP